jgi:polar amino acid transport system substrate-binding protein
MQRVGRTLRTFALISLCAVGGAQFAPDFKSAMANEADYSLITPGTLTVIVTPLMPKIAMGDGENQLKGYEGWLVMQVAKELKLQIKPFVVTFTGAILAVKENKADLGTDMYYTPERAKQVFYTVPNMADLTGFLMPSSTPYVDADSLKGKPIGTQTGYVYVNLINSYYGKEYVKTYPDLASVVAALKNGQIAAYVGGTGSGAALLQSNPELVIHPIKKGELGMPESMRKSTVHWYVNCSNKKLAETIDRILKEKMQSPEWLEQLKPWGLEGDEFRPEYVPPASGC